MATLLKKVAFLRGLIHGERAYTGPLLVNIDLTRRCNLRCPGCIYHSYLKSPGGRPAARETYDIELPFLRRICGEFKAMGTTNVTIQGSGEPLLHPDFSEMLSTVKGHGFETTLITNGTLLDEDYIRAAIETRLDTLKVSLWASSAEEYEKNYPGADPGNFNKVTNALRLLSRLKREAGAALPRVFIHHPINRLNYHDIDEMVSLAAETGCDGITFSPFSTIEGKTESLQLSPENLAMALGSLKLTRDRLRLLGMSHNLDETLLRFKVGRDVWDSTPCYTPWYHARIRVDGTVQTCGRCEIPLGNITSVSFSDVWNGEAMRSFRRAALSPVDMSMITKNCECNYCCFVWLNSRIHRRFRSLTPFLWRRNLRGK